MSGEIGVLCFASLTLIDNPGSRSPEPVAISSTCMSSIIASGGGIVLSVSTNASNLYALRPQPLRHRYSYKQTLSIHARSPRRKTIGRNPTPCTIPRTKIRQRFIALPLHSLASYTIVLCMN